MSHTTRQWRLNPRAAIIIGIALLILIPGFFGAQWYNNHYGRSALLTQAKGLVEQKRPDLALRYLNEYLDRNPEDAEALDLKGRLLADSARAYQHLVDAIKTNEQVIRLDPNRPSRQATRRRLVELHLRLGDLAPEAGRFRTAEVVVGQMMDAAKAQGKPLDAAELRLAARVMEGLASLEVDRDSAHLRTAIERYEEARTLDPANIEGAERLARLYAQKAGQPEQGLKVLDDLARANPSSSAPLLARYRYFTSLAQSEAQVAKIRESEQKAAAALAAAIKAAPKDFDVLLVAAEDSMRRGDTKEARRYLDQLPEDRREDYRARFVRGMIDLQDNRAEEAIANWRKGLLDSDGSDVQLTWQLAFALLHMGRIAEAEPLMAQFRRLSGGEEPSPAYRYLEGLKALKQNQPVKAIGAMTEARTKINPILLAQLLYTQAICYEAIRDERQALELYDRSSRAAPKWSAPRLARIRLLVLRAPEIAAAEMNEALAEIPDDPSLLVAQARAELRKQVQNRSKVQPKWKDLAAMITHIRQVSPNAPGLFLLEADSLAEAGRLDECIAALEKATELRKGDVDLWLALAARQAQPPKNNVDEALKTLERASAPDTAGRSALVRIRRADLMIRQGHGKEARELLVKDLDRLDPDQVPLIWQRLGDLYASQASDEGRTQAIRAYKEWARLLPDDPVPRLFLLEQDLARADRVTDGDEKAAAEKAVREGIEGLKGIGGSSENLHYRVAEALELIRDRKSDSEKDRAVRLDKARDLIEAIQKEAPQQRFAYLLRGYLAEKTGKFDEAKAAYKDAMEHEGGPGALQRLILLYTKTKDFRGLEQLRKDFPDAASGLTRLAAVLSGQLGEKDQAAKLADVVAQADPDDVDAQVWYAKMLSALDKPQEAEQTLQALVEKRPGEVGPLLALLYFQVSRRQTQAARQTIDKIKASVKNPTPEFLHAQCYRAAGDMATAEALYKESLAKWPEDSRVVRGVADFYETTNRPDRAIECLSAALERNPSQRWAARALALLLSNRAGDQASWARAWELIGPAKVSDTPEDRLARAIILARGSKPQQRSEAIDQLERLIDDLPADLMAASAARSFLARLYLAEGRVDQAAATAAADAGPGAGPVALALHVETLLRAKKWDQAEKQLDRLAKLMPNDMTTEKLRARYLLARGKPEEAAAAMEKLFNARRDGPQGEEVGREVAAILFELNQIEAAERVASAMAEKWPERAKGILGTVRAVQGRPEQAMDLYSNAVSSGSDPVAVQEAVANAIALATGKRRPDLMDRADAILVEAMKHNPNATDLIVKRGYLRHFQGRYEEEFKLYQDAMQRNPDDYRFLNNMAWVLSEGLHRPEEALGHINEAIRRAGGARYYQFFDTRGVVYTRLGQHDRAIQDLEQAVQINPTPTVYAHLARAYHKAGRMDDFRKTRDAAKKAGLTPEKFEPVDREELEKLLFSEKS